MQVGLVDMVIPQDDGHHLRFRIIMAPKLLDGKMQLSAAGGED